MLIVTIAFRFSDEDKSVRVCVINFLVKLISLCDSSALQPEILNVLDDFIQHFVMSLTEEVCHSVCVCVCVNIIMKSNLCFIHPILFPLVIENLSGEATLLHQLSHTQNQAETGPVSHCSHLQDQQGKHH